MSDAKFTSVRTWEKGGKERVCFFDPPATEDEMRAWVSSVWRNDPDPDIMDWERAGFPPVRS